MIFFLHVDEKTMDSIMPWTLEIGDLTTTMHVTFLTDTTYVT